MTHPQLLDPTLFLDPANRPDFLSSITPEKVVYFIVNVGDGDAQIILLPYDRGRRDVLVVDIFKGTKVTNLIKSLEQVGLVTAASRFTLVATHPHRDHISGAGHFIKFYRTRIDEVWDSGYRHTGADYDRYSRALQEVHDDPNPDVNIEVLQPTAGMTRYKGQVRITVLAPAIRLRNRYDTYGIYVNDASLVLKLEFPVQRLRLREPMNRSYRYASIILGADAQTASWAGTMLDFPTLHSEKGGSQTAASLSLTLERDEPLSADILKVSHHGSKRGINYELVERIAPKLLAVSCSDASTHGFPHDVAQELLREARQAIAGSHVPPQRKLDSALGIMYTSDRLDVGTFASSKSESKAVSEVASHGVPVGNERELGSFGIVMGERQGNAATKHIRVWRFRDSVGQDVDPDNGIELGHLRS